MFWIYRDKIGSKKEQITSSHEMSMMKSALFCLVLLSTLR